MNYILNSSYKGTAHLLKSNYNFGKKPFISLGVVAFLKSEFMVVV